MLVNHRDSCHLLLSEILNHTTFENECDYRIHSAKNWILMRLKFDSDNITTLDNVYCCFENIYKLLNTDQKVCYFVMEEMFSALQKLTFAELFAFSMKNKSNGIFQKHMRLYIKEDAFRKPDFDELQELTRSLYDGKEIELNE